MTDLTSFLLARIAEDEAAARATLRSWPWNSLTEDDPDHSGEIHAPKRWLVECEAKRRIVNAWRSGFPEEDRYSTGWHDFHVHALYLLALPYADHPDYDETWRP